MDCSGWATNRKARTASNTSRCFPAPTHSGKLEDHLETTTIEGQHRVSSERRRRLGQLHQLHSAPLDIGPSVPVLSNHSWRAEPSTSPPQPHSRSCPSRAHAPQSHSPCCVGGGQLLPTIDQWLYQLFDDDHIDDTVSALSQAESTDISAAEEMEARRAIKDCDRRIANFETALGVTGDADTPM